MFLKRIFVCLLFSLSSFNVFATGPDLSTDIVGGEAALEGEIEFIVSLQSRGQHICGGSLVAPNWVLTAAHCVVGFIRPNSVLIGTLDVTEKQLAETITIEKIISHPDYSSSTISHDFALLKLAKDSKYPPVEYNKVQISEVQDSLLTVAGWGTTREGERRGSDILLKTEVPIIESQTCEELLQKARPANEPYITEAMFCAGYSEGGKDSCQGDSGGPIFYVDQQTQKQVLMGVVSWGLGCARKNSPGVYGNITVVQGWIEAEVFVSQALSSIEY